MEEEKQSSLGKNRARGEAKHADKKREGGSKNTSIWSCAVNIVIFSGSKQGGEGDAGGCKFTLKPPFFNPARGFVVQISDTISIFLLN